MPGELTYHTISFICRDNICSERRSKYSYDKYMYVSYDNCTEYVCSRKESRRKKLFPHELPSTYIHTYVDKFGGSCGERICKDSIDHMYVL